MLLEQKIKNPHIEHAHSSEGREAYQAYSVVESLQDIEDDCERCQQQIAKAVQQLPGDRGTDTPCQ